MFETYVRLIHVDKKSSPLNEQSFHLNKKSSHINRKTSHSTGRLPTSSGSYTTAIQAANHNRRFIRLYTSLNYSVPATCWRSRTTTNPRKRSSFASLNRIDSSDSTNRTSLHSTKHSLSPLRLLPGTIERWVEAGESPRCETVRFQRAEEDGRYGWGDVSEVFDGIISGQNDDVAVDAAKE